MYLTIKRILAAAVLSASVVYAAFAMDPPHTDYRSGYVNNCFSGTAACHVYYADTFLPAELGPSGPTDYTGFCLSCHNTAGEAHEKSAGSSSTIEYVNLTGFDPDGAYDGDSHSWKGIAGVAGTRFPTLSGFDGTYHMPNGVDVTCQICHDGMRKRAEENIDWIEMTDLGDLTRFRLLGYSTTKQYLAKYLRVYRADTDTMRPTYSRTKKEYLVDPSEYFYGYSTAVLTFYAAQPFGTRIYADIPQPYYRESNENNAICLDCHNDRADTVVSHPHGTGVKDNHPVRVVFGHISGLNDTLKASPDADVFIEGGEVMCTSCHDPHNAASDDGYNIIRRDASDVCAACHIVNGFGGATTIGLLADHDGYRHSDPTRCLDCHTMHNTTNIMLIRERINGRRVTFLDFTGADSFGNENTSSVCEVCHTTTNFHRWGGTGSTHHTGENCTSCHPHSNGFYSGCDGCVCCHGFPPPPVPNGWQIPIHPDGHDNHMSYLNSSSFGYLNGLSACNECHGGGGLRTDHRTNKYNAGIDTSTWRNWSTVGGDWGPPIFDYGSSIGMINTGDDTCTNVSCHAAPGTRMWGGQF